MMVPCPAAAIAPGVMLAADAAPATFKNSLRFIAIFPTPGWLLATSYWPFMTLPGAGMSSS